MSYEAIDLKEHFNLEWVTAKPIDADGVEETPYKKYIYTDKSGAFHSLAFVSKARFYDSDEDKKGFQSVFTYKLNRKIGNLLGWKNKELTVLKTEQEAIDRVYDLIDWAFEKQIATGKYPGDFLIHSLLDK